MGLTLEWESDLRLHSLSSAIIVNKNFYCCKGVYRRLGNLRIYFFAVEIFTLVIFATWQNSC